MDIYVVDDDPLVLQTLLDFLSELGHTAIPVLSVHELLGRVEASYPKAGVVIAKPEIVGPDCLDVLRDLHQRHPELAFILVTGAGSSCPAHEAVSCGVYALLRQPIRLSELELSLIRLCESQLVER